MKNKITYLIITIVAIGIQSGTLLAQKKSSDKCVYTFERLEKRAPWIVSENGAGLVFNNALNYSTVGAYYGLQDGDYRNYNEAGKYQTFGIQTKSYVKSKKVYFYGSFIYDYGVKNNQAWLGTIYPGSTINPILDSIPGKVLREDYILAAKVGYPINDTWSVGGAFDYHTATGAKRSDGRNANTFSHFKASPGITFHKGIVTSGINFNYQHYVEDVVYSYIGETTGKYIKYMEGLFFMSSSGISSTTTLDRKYNTDIFGGALQFEIGGKKLKFFNQIKVDYNKENDFEDGLIKRYATVDGLKYQYDGLFSYRSKKVDHTLALNFVSNEQFSYNVSNIYEEIENEPGWWAFFEYGKTLRYIQTQQQYGAEYKGFLRRGQGLGCSFVGTLGVNYISVEKDFKIYPASYHQDYTNTEVYAKLDKNIRTTNNGFVDINISGNYTIGEGTMLESTNPIVTGSLRLNEDILKRDFAYRTADRANVGFGVKYSHIFNHEKGLTAYLGANYAHQFLVNDGGLDVTLDGVLPGTYRNMVSVQIGLNF